MRKSSIVSLLLIAMLLLAPIAEADTIKIVSYLPIVNLSQHEGGKKSSHHDHKKSLEKINYLLDSLKAEINGEAEEHSLEAVDWDKEQESTSQGVCKNDDSSRQKKQKLSYKEDKLRGKGIREQEQSSQSQNEGKINTQASQIHKQTDKKSTESHAEEAKPIKTEEKSEAQHHETGNLSAEKTSIHQQSEDVIKSEHTNTAIASEALVDEHINGKDGLNVDEAKTNQVPKQIKNQQNTLQAQKIQDPIPIVTSQVPQIPQTNPDEQATHQVTSSLQTPTESALNKVSQTPQPSLIHPEQAKTQSAGSTAEPAALIAASTQALVDSQEHETTAKIEKPSLLVPSPSEDAIQIAATPLIGEPAPQILATVQHNEVSPSPESLVAVSPNEAVSKPQTTNISNEIVAVPPTPLDSTITETPTSSTVVTVAPIDQHTSIQEVAPTESNIIATTESPSLTAESPSLTAESPSLTAESPSLTAESPSLTAESPSLTAESPSLTAESPSLTAESPSLTAESPSLTAESPSLTAESPSLTAESPSLTAESPSLTAESPSLTAESPSLTAESPSNSPTIVVSNQSNITQPTINTQTASIQPTVNTQTAKPLEAASNLPTNDSTQSSNDPFMASFCMPMCDYESSAPVCEHQACRACRSTNECVEEASIFEAHPHDYDITCDVPTGRCIKKEKI